MAKAKSAPSQGEMPQYRLTEQAYIHDRLVEAGEAIYFDGIPGAHMAPLNAEARAMVNKYKPVSSPIGERLATTGESSANP